MEEFFFSFSAPSQKFVRRRAIANEHDLRAGNGEDGVQIIVTTDNCQEYYEQCSRWRALVFGQL
jgi:hypothetical protein